MDKKRIFVTIAVALMLIIAGCSETGSNEASEELQKNTGTDLKGVEVGGSYDYESKLTEKNQEGLVTAQPPEQMDQSLERQNLRNRYEYLNDQNNQHYVYLLSHGNVVTWYTAQGKVSSINSKLTNDRQIVASPACREEKGANGGDDETNCYKAVESPQMDGSYGENGDGIFFFTTDGRYVEWNGEYIVSEQPLNIESSVTLTQQVNESDGE